MSNFLHRLLGLEDSAETRERLEKLEIAMRRLDEEWTDVYNKFRNLQMRVAKQAQRLEESSSHEEAQGAGDDLPAQPAGGLSLTPGQQRLQEQLARFRARGKVGE